MAKFNSENLDKVIKILRREVRKYRPPVVSFVADHTKNDPFLILISCLLSLRTQDKTTEKATKKLFQLAKTPQEMLKLSLKEIEKAIYPVGFYRVKAGNIKRICATLVDKFFGKVPDDLDKLLSLPGVGRKTANLVLTEGFNKLGVCVDTHVHRISNRWGMVETKTPEQTEFALREILPRRYWKEFNYLLVTYGQNICKPINPRCLQCKIYWFCAKRGVNKSWKFRKRR
ncbi:MAG: endonuclease III [Candidatus Omnitrophica bacterium]|nr:endonuclease III [Candidatus Omnitrophota bacterium]MCM8793986.1 endonuclease III [Candidatus Omnitrophota bacterium]